MCGCFSVSSGLQSAGRVDLSRCLCVCVCVLSLTHGSLGKSKSLLTTLSHRQRRLRASPLAVPQTSELKSPPVHQLDPNFFFSRSGALRKARPLLSCHPSCPDATRCLLVAIQLFIFLFLPPSTTSSSSSSASRDVSSV